MTRPITIFQFFKHIELQEQNQRDECASSIKAIHAAGGHEFKGIKPKVRRLSGNVMKFSPNGRFIGWYRQGQKSGLPHRSSPAAQEMEKLYQDYKHSIISAFPQSVTGSVLGTRSGAVRKENGLFNKIQFLQQQLIYEGKPKRHIPKLISKALSCNTEFVRRTLRAINKAL